MFNLDKTRMQTFYNCVEDDSKEESKEPIKNNNINNNNNHINIGKIGYPCRSGSEATRVSGIDKLLPGSLIDSHLFSPCGYSCNGMFDTTILTKNAIDNNNTSNTISHSKSNDVYSIIGKQGKDQQSYFTIHVTPEPQCSFVSFETNVVLSNYTQLVQNVVNTFQPGSFCMSLFVDEGADISDSRKGLKWEYKNYITKGTTHHAFEAGCK